MSATPTETVLRVRHDSWTRLLYLQLGAFAFFLYAFSPSIDLLKDDLHISAGVAGLHSTCYAVGVTVGSLSTPWYIRRMGGSRPALWWGLVGLSLSVGLFCAVPSLSVTLPAAAICGVFGSLLCIAVPAALSRAHGPETGPAAITEANAVAAFVGIAAPLAVGGADALGIGWRAALLSVAPLSALLYVVLGRVREPEWIAAEAEPVTVGEAVEAYGLGMVDTAGGLSEADEPADRDLAECGAVVRGSEEHGTRGSTIEASSQFAQPAEQAGGLRTQAVVPSPRGASDHVALPSARAATFRDLSRRFWLNQLAGVCAGAVEFCLTLWCATLLRDRAHLSAGVAATGVTAVVAGMAVGRAVGGRLALRVPIDRLIFTAFGTNLVGFAIFWATPNPFLMFGGLAVAGLGVSLQFPLLSARAIEMSGGEAELAGAVNMFGSGVAVGTAPFALGFLSDRVGIHTAYLLLPGFIIAAVLAVAASGRRGTSET
ncbi:major facilitator superfamily MFS_1 [Catenulispora acidiphila DSM 44928]|uniref:Major facilitator superfamily MFS_1 n=1 Tax=Catenulispora acidiphila (strain DSM 44928 / JCM 14897 / NBRC 102108 / NRRL B-24433 / ID139908) TaxID=479433 RepID=C7QH59_CATAD|nr:MFS transporter [Catenulispora acidiphila]ACU76909.1 major facilitator superfamily MFS_1 [Catenulispora acidiphila DSM 44928]